MNAAWRGCACCGLALVAACQLAKARSIAAPWPEWLQGQWAGTRRDGSNGSTAPMQFSVRPILAGAGFTEDLEVRGERSVYRGFAAIVFDREQARWVMQYANAGKGRFARLESDPGSEPLVFRSVTPDRTDDSALTYERRGDAGLVRTMRVAERGAAADTAAWRVLWQDDLQRVNH